MEDPATTGHGIDVVHGQTVLGQRLQDHVLAEAELLGERLALERLQLLGPVLQLLGEALLLALVHRDLGGGRAGVDRQHH